MGFVSDFVGDVLGDITGANQATQGAVNASNLQYAATEKGIAEQRRQFDKLVELMAPFVTGGQSAVSAQQNLLGLGGAQAQQQAIAGLQNSPQMQAMLQQGENALLQNASATGGLRGGNTQGALATFRPQLLNQMIQQQYGNLGGLAQLGQASVAGQASAGLQTGSNISNLLQQGGAAQAGGAIAQGNRLQNNLSSGLNLAGTLFGAFF